MNIMTFQGISNRTVEFNSPEGQPCSNFILFNKNTFLALINTIGFVCFPFQSDRDITFSRPLFQDEDESEALM